MICNEILLNSVYRWSRKSKDALAILISNKNSANSIRIRRFNMVSLTFFPLVERPLCRSSARNLSTVNDCSVCCENPEIVSSARLKYP